MPNLKLFKRRSSQNALDLPPSDQPESTPPAQSSFRVLERPKKATHNFDGPVDTAPPPRRPFRSPLEQLRGRSVDELGLGINGSAGEPSRRPDGTLKVGRGSGGTTNSDSSRYYESSAASARHSSSSTLPSSIDQERELENEELFPRKAATAPMLHASVADGEAPLPAPPSFSSRAARAFSFGNRHNRAGSTSKDVPPLPSTAGSTAPRSPQSTHTAQRERSMTSSSYASTAKPPQHEQDFNLGSTSFGDELGSMFSGLTKYSDRSREDLASPPANVFHRTESEPMFPARTLNRQALTPSPNRMNGAGDDSNSPYMSDEHDANEGLMSSSALSSPRLNGDLPTPPPHITGIAPAFLGRSKAGYSLVPERNPSPAPERSSYDSNAENEPPYTNGSRNLAVPNSTGRHDEASDAQDEVASKFSYQMSDAGSKRSQINTYSRATAGASDSAAVSPSTELSNDTIPSSNATPKASKLTVSNVSKDSLFDSSPSGPASRAIRPGHQRTDSGAIRLMTKAQYDYLQRSGNSSLDNSEDEVPEEDADDDLDDIERAKQATRQRRKQEANMAVYRQQMKKVTGGGPTDLPSVRPSMERAPNSAPPTTGMASLHLGGIGGKPPADAVRGKPTDDDDEDVPLGILQAHGFPGAGRPPTRQGENEAQRTASAGSIVNGGAGQGNLPPFARRLPADPYFGASLVNPAHRESIAFSTAGSVYGAAPPAMMPQQQMGPAGGLVGVIANEERAKASRRGSPNPITGTYNTPLPSNMPQQMPPMPRTMSMGNMIAPQVYTPSGFMPGMAPMPGMPPMMAMDPGQQQMQQFMQMQMQWMQNMLVMQQQQLSAHNTPQPMPPTMDYLGVQSASQRPMSMASHAPSFQAMPPNQGRAMTMMGPPPQWDANRGQQRPTSALPNSYAPSGFNVAVPAHGYAPSIAPSERSNVGMPSRYRPVTPANDNAANGRSHSLTSSMTLQAFSGQGNTNKQAPAPKKSTIRLVDKPKGAAKATTRPVNPDDEEDDWADMAKKRNEKKFGWRKKDSKAGQEPALSELYTSVE